MSRKITKSDIHLANKYMKKVILSIDQTSKFKCDIRFFPYQLGKVCFYFFHILMVVSKHGIAKLVFLHIDVRT